MRGHNSRENVLRTRGARCGNRRRFQPSTRALRAGQGARANRERGARVSRAAPHPCSRSCAPKALYHPQAVAEWVQLLVTAQRGAACACECWFHTRPIHSFLKTMPSHLYSRAFIISSAVLRFAFPFAKSVAKSFETLCFMLSWILRLILHLTIPW